MKTESSTKLNFTINNAFCQYFYCIILPLLTDFIHLFFNNNCFLAALFRAHAAFYAFALVNLKRLFDFALRRARGAVSRAERAAYALFLVDADFFYRLIICRGAYGIVGADIFALTAAAAFFGINGVK